MLKKKKMYEVLTHATTGINLENIMVSKIGQSQKDTYCLIPLIWSAYCCLVAQLCPTHLQPHGLQPTMLLYLWDIPGKNTGVGCHFLNEGFQGGKESACQFKRPRFDPWVGKMPGRGNGTHSSILAWKVPWTEEPGGLQSMGSQNITHHWRDWACKQ